MELYAARLPSPERWESRMQRKLLRGNLTIECRRSFFLSPRRSWKEKMKKTPFPSYVLSIACSDVMDSEYLFCSPSQHSYQPAVCSAKHKGSEECVVVVLLRSRFEFDPLQERELGVSQ
jgi:hypothetical protein